MATVRPADSDGPLHGGGATPPGARRLAGILLVALLAGLPGCKDINDYLNDLNAVHDPKTGDHVLASYDAGQLCHEGLTGIMEEDAITLAQLGRAIAFAAEIIQRDRNALSRSDAAVLIAFLVTRYPIAPRTTPYPHTGDVNQLAQEQIQTLSEHSDILAIETTLLPSLDAPDPVAVRDAVDTLRRISGEDFGSDREGWRTWWDREKGPRLADAIERSREPVRILGETRYATLAASRSVLKYLSLQLAVYPYPEMREVFRDAILSTARQTAIHALVHALQRRGEEPRVRMDVALAMAEIRDPAFGRPLAEQMVRESDPDVQARLGTAILAWPSRQAVEALVRFTASDEGSVALNSALTLDALTGNGFGRNPARWTRWWEEQGQIRWP